MIGVSEPHENSGVRRLVQANGGYMVDASHGVMRCRCHRDRNPSVSVTVARRADDGTLWVLLHCFAGCEWRDVFREALSAAGMTQVDLLRGLTIAEAGEPFPSIPPKPRSSSEPLGRDVARNLDEAHRRLMSNVGPWWAYWVYLNRRGVSDDIMREFNIGCEPGWITVPIPRDGQIVNVFRRRVGGGEPRWRGMAERGAEVFPDIALIERCPFVVWCEGISDVLVARSHGLSSAFTLTAGAKGRVPDVCLEKLRVVGKVAVVMDCDTAGRRAAKSLEAQLVAAGLSVVVLDLGLPQKGDLADYFVLGGTAAELQDEISRIHHGNMRHARRGPGTRCP